MWAFVRLLHRLRDVSGYHGGVRNCDDGRVELEVEGPKGVIETLLNELTIGPPAAAVSQIETMWGQPTGRFSDFHIWYEHRSS